LWSCVTWLRKRARFSGFFGPSLISGEGPFCAIIVQKVESPPSPATAAVRTTYSSQPDREMSNKGDDNVPLMENKDPESQEEEEPVELRPLPIRAAHALLNTLFLLFGKEYGWAGFCYLTLATVCSVTTSIYTSWLGGCIVMMVFFASVFCFAGYQAVSGRYELARPLLLAGMAMFLTCILGGHFFREWSLHAGSELFDGISLADMPGKTKGYSKNAVFFWKDGAVDTTRQGEYKLCKDKLPVVGTCVYDYFCVAPIKAQGDDSTVVKAWAGILSHVECQDRTFLTSEERLQWGDDARAGLGIVRNKHWNSAIANALNTTATEVAGAPLVEWTGDPMQQEREAWNTAWSVECGIFGGYLVLLMAYSVTMGYSAEAYPTSRKILDPNAKPLPSRRKLTPKT